MIVASKQRSLDEWEQLIAEAVHQPNPVQSNHQVTQAHYQLSLALQQVVGPESGANFHTWAVWGSRKAGVTIREEGLERAMREVTALSFTFGLLAGLLLGMVLWRWLPGWVVPGMATAGASCGAWTGRQWLIRGRRRAATLMLAGNRTVLQDIGGQTARFVTWFIQTERHDPAGFAPFLEEFRSGRTEEGGQDLLRRAFTHYYRAALTDEIPLKQQAVYLANCLAIRHEHIRLQPYIAGALPWIVRRCVTCRLMRYDVGPLRLTVGDDVPGLDVREYPESLKTLTDPELVEFGLCPNGLERGDNTRAGTRARDWTRLEERMRYIVNLFRALHLHPDVFRKPYSDSQLEQIRAGEIPQGPL